MCQHGEATVGTYRSNEYCETLKEADVSMLMFFDRARGELLGHTEGGMTGW